MTSKPKQSGRFLQTAGKVPEIQLSLKSQPKDSLQATDSWVGGLTEEEHSQLNALLGNQLKGCLISSEYEVGLPHLVQVLFQLLLQLLVYLSVNCSVLCLELNLCLFQQAVFLSSAVRLLCC